MATIAQNVGSDWNQEPRASAGHPTLLPGTGAFVSSSVGSQALWQEPKSKAEETSLESELWYGCKQCKYQFKLLHHSDDRFLFLLEIELICSFRKWAIFMSFLVLSLFSKVPCFIHKSLHLELINELTD